MTIKYLDSKRISALSSDALVAHLKFNDNVTDSAGSNNGTVTGTTTYVTGKVDKAFSFDGSSYITLANENNFDFERTDPFSVSFWVYNKAGISFTRIVSKATNIISSVIGWSVGRSTDINEAVGLVITDGTTPFNIATNGGEVPLNTWTYLTFTYDGSSNQSGMKSYVNGVLSNTGTSSAMTSTIMNNESVVIGAESDGGRTFTGYLDDLRIYSRELDQNEVNVIYNGGTGTEGSLKPTNVQDNSILVEKDTGKRFWYDGSYWNPKLPTVAGLKLHLDASDLSTITKDGSNLVSQWDDKSGNGNHFLQATATNQPLWVNAVHNSNPTIRFDGIDNYIKNSGWTGGALTDPNTFFMVCTFPNNSTDPFLFDGYADGGNRHTFYRNASDYYVIYAGGNASSSPTTTSTALAQFTLLYNSTSSTIRRNGSQIGSTGSVGSETTDGLNLGAVWNNTQPSAFDVCEFIIYNADVSGTDRTLIEDYLATKWGL
jgi:hypothetical protein